MLRSSLVLSLVLATTDLALADTKAAIKADYVRPFLTK